MSYVIITRNPTSGKLLAIMEDDAVAEFELSNEAQQVADEVPICQAWGYSIVEVDV